MRKYFFSLIFLGVVNSYAQYANVEISSGGFSFIPAFMDKNPNINFNLGTGNNKLFSAHIVGSIRVENISPRSLIFITRLKAIDKKFKLSIGSHLPAVQINKEYYMDTFFAQEVIMSYPISNKYNLSSLYIHGKGRNNDLEINLFVLNNNFSFKSLNYLFQLYYLDKGNLYGFAHTLDLKIKDKIILKGFLNYTIPTNDMIPTIGLKFIL